MAGVDDVDENLVATQTSPAALVGWGMTLLAVGALIMVSALTRQGEGDRPGFAVVGGLVLLFGWGALTGGVVVMARQVDRLARRDDVTVSSTAQARPPR